MLDLTFSILASATELGEKAVEVAEDTRSLGEKMGEAGLHTLLGMGIVFLVLILISFIIYLLSFIGKTGKRKSEKTMEKTISETAETLDPEPENLTDDSELVAVIMSAIQAYEGTDTGKFRVTSIRKTATKNIWKRG